MENYKKLAARLAEVNNLNNAVGVLGYDQQVFMPPAGAEARGAQLSTLARISHELFTSDETGTLLQKAAQELKGTPYDSDEASMVRVVQQDYDQQVKIPSELVAEMAMVSTMAHETWVHARANNDFAHFAPTLEKVLGLVVKTAEYLGYDENPYDALVNIYERGITTAEIKRIFDGHKAELVQLVADIGAVSDRVSDAPINQKFPIDQQREFGIAAVKALGFDMQRGRQDVAVHPFQASFSRNDVRITTRFNEGYLGESFFGMLHEAGHGMYEQGVAEALDGTMLGNGTSLGVHESQSRMWENIVGRSREFWQWALPVAKDYFPEQFATVSVEDVYKAVNKVERSYIRVEADEATYNLHIMLRFELENDMVNGRVNVNDLPKIWNERFEAYLGIVPPTDTLGVLQDIHWSGGGIGYFPTYALGNLLSVQYYNQALKEYPSIPDEIASGKFSTLLSWLNTNIHQHGRKFTSAELTKNITGESIQSTSYMSYLKKKFGEVYGL